MTSMVSVCTLVLSLPKQRLTVKVKVDYPAVEIHYPITPDKIPPPVIKQLTLTKQNVSSVYMTRGINSPGKSRVKRGPRKGQSQNFYGVIENRAINVDSKRLLKLFKNIATLTLSGSCFYFCRTGNITADYQCVNSTTDFRTVRVVGYRTAARRVNLK